jgi:hypothetical protein
MVTTGLIDVIVRTWWPTAIIAQGEVELQCNLDMQYINEGISIQDEVSDYHPSGMDHSQTDVFGGDITRFFLIGASEGDVRKRFRALAKMADDFNAAKTDTYYSHIYPRLQEGSWDKGEDGRRPITKWWRWMQVPVLFSLNNYNLKST